MKRLGLVISIAAAFCSMGQSALAATAYVTDSFRVCLRRGPSIENKILKFLPSGQPVEVFESQEGWSRIVLSDREHGQIEGWVLSRYLISRLPWETQARLLGDENQQLGNRLAVLEEGRGKARQEHLNLAESVRILTKENHALRSAQRSKWLTIGALVLLGGLMIGLILGGQQKRRKSSYMLD